MMAGLVDSPEISGLLYKRRGGFGKMMPNAWQFRFFAVTKDGILLYFDTEIPDVEHLETKARGKLDLKAVNFELSTDHIEGAPTSHGISIAAANEEKWKMCAETKDDQVRWLRVFNKYIALENKVLPRGPISYTSDDDSDRPGMVRGLSRMNSSLPPISSRDANNNITTSSFATTPTNNSGTWGSTGKGKNALAGDSSATNAPANSGNKAVVVSPPSISAGHKKHLKMSLHAHQKPNYEEKDKYELILVIAVVNIAFLGLWRSSSLFLILFYLLVGNFVVIFTLQLRGFRASKEVTEQHKGSESITKSPKQSNEVVSQICNSNADILIANDPLPTIEEIVGLPSGKPIAGSTLPHSDEDYRTALMHTWTKIDSKLFQVRIGPEYNRYKKKAPSAPPLYEAVAVDIFCARQRVDHAAERFQLPDVSNIQTNNPHVPPIFVVQLQIPSDPPKSIFSSSDNGPGWALVMYYRITEDTCQQLKDLSTASPAVKLWAEWCEKAAHDPAMRARFKVINMCSNMEQLGFSSVIVSYNGKPVLIRRTGSLFRGANYLEFDVHVHKFDTFAKQGIFQISSLCGNMYMQVGFVIEGREDSELPEVLFGCVAVNRPQEDLAEFLFDE
jgi:hypothetical protein